MCALRLPAMLVTNSVSSIRRAVSTFVLHPTIGIKDDVFMTKAFPFRTPFTCSGLACKHWHWPQPEYAVSLSRTLCKVAQAVKNDMGISLRGVSDKDTIEDVKRIIELAESASLRREVMHSDFLLPPVLKESVHRLQAMAEVKFVAQGGYPEAERCRLSVGHPDALKDDPDIVSALSISGNFSFQPCSHGDFLGSILGTGISRDKVGDILLQGEKGAHVLVVPELVDYIISSLDKVGNVSVTCKKIPLLAIEYEPPRTKSLKTIETSVRLDAIASAGFKISRSKMATLISNGDVRVNWSTVLKNNTTVRAGDIISVSGKGRLKVGEINITRKQKYAIELIRYV